MTLGDNILVNQTLDAMRQAARSQAYPNSEVETSTVQTLEQQVARKVGEHESDLVITATTVLSAGEHALVESDALLADMSGLLNEVERAGANVSGGLAARYQSLRHGMELRIKELAKIERDAEFHAEKVLDPYGSLQRLRQKYPQIVMGRSL